MIKILAIGDPHFKVSNVKDTAALHTESLTKVSRESPDFVVVLGDTLDRFENIHSSPLSRAVAWLSDLQKLTKVFLLLGNHDLKNNKQFCSEEHPFTALKNWPNLTVVDKPISTTIKGKIFSFVPYVEPGRFIEALDLLGDVWKSSTCIFGHQEFYGCHMGAMHSTDGDKWSVTLPMVITGHIHDYQILQDNIVYTGTPLQHGYGDRSDKTITLLDIAEDGTIKHSRVYLNIPRKLIIHLHCSQVSTYEIKDSGDLKFVITGTAGEIKAIMKLPQISTWKELGYKVVFKNTPINPVNILITPTDHKPQKFAEILHKRIGEDMNCKQLFDEIFASPINFTL